MVGLFFLFGRQSADDLVGRVIVSLKDLMKKPNVLHDREDHLSGFEDADAMDGTVTWSVGYFDKVCLFVLQTFLPSSGLLISMFPM